MSISAVSSNSQTAGAAGEKPASGISMPGMDSGAFMQVLLAQLRHQNPLEPMNDQQMIGQMAQLNSLEELQKINSSLETLVDLSRRE
jgi:flagellar basal-body rod modification protein FlgD